MEVHEYDELKASAMKLGYDMNQIVYQEIKHFINKEIDTKEVFINQLTGKFP